MGGGSKKTKPIQSQFKANFNHEGRKKGLMQDSRATKTAKAGIDRGRRIFFANRLIFLEISHPIRPYQRASSLLGPISMPLEPPQLFNSDLPDREIHKKAICEAVMLVDTEASKK